jgi:hypothetical protein
VAGSAADRDSIIADLYGEVYPELRDIFDARLGLNEKVQGIIYGQEAVFAGDNPVNVMREERLASLRENILFMKNKLRELKEGLDYITEKKTNKT